MVQDMLAFLIMLNPFALFIYLKPVMDELENKKFNKVLLKASLISFAVYVAFAILGEFLFSSVFKIKFDSFRIFGGIVIFSFAYFYIVMGRRALIHIKEDLDDLASEIAIPFIVGAGSISLAILAGYKYPTHIGIGIIAGVLISNFIVVLFLKFLKDRIARNRFKVAFDKNMAILMRLNAFMVGAIGVDMIVSGIYNIYFK
jgi:multiple antibiotic resistance protein